MLNRHYLRPRLNNQSTLMRAVLFWLIPLLCLLSPGANANKQWRSHSFEVMGTQAQIEIWSSDNSAQSIFQSVESEMRRIEQIMSPYIESSELSAINRLRAGQPLSLSQEMYHILTQSLEISSLTSGAFDISYASVGHLYNYREKQQPSDEQIRQTLAAVDYRSIELNHTSDDQYTLLLQKNGMRLDLGGIAKGYAVDRAIAILKASNIESGLVSAGGDSRILGYRSALDAKGEAKPWVIGIKHPRDADKMALRLPLSNTSISTSGDYERYFMDGPQRLHHIIHPATGRSSTGVVSATVIGPQSIRCDALSTSIFVLGVEHGLALINGIIGYDAIMIDHNGRVHYSSGLSE